jgi:hypothetical protein
VCVCVCVCVCMCGGVLVWGVVTHRKCSQPGRPSLGIDNKIVARTLQKLDVSQNSLRSLPDKLTSLTNLKELCLRQNSFSEPPVSILRHLTALVTIDLRFYRRWGNEGSQDFRIPSSLLPILHPGLLTLDVRQFAREPGPFTWDSMSLVHLGRAMAELAKRRPVPAVLFKEQPGVLS